MNLGAFSNITHTKMEIWIQVFNSKYSEHETGKRWNERLLIVTEKRMFIARKTSGFKSSDETLGTHLEIVDSIPMKEVESVQLELDAQGTWDDGGGKPSANSAHAAFASISKAASRLAERIAPSDAAGSRAGSVRNLLPTGADLLAGGGGGGGDGGGGGGVGKALRERLPGDAGDYSGRLLRIATKAGGFNHGQCYYMMLRRGEFPRLRRGGAEVARDAIGGGGGGGDGGGGGGGAGDAAAEALAARLGKWALRCAAASRRRTRLARAQRRAREAWESTGFHAALLVLIAANFVFTVKVGAKCRARACLGGNRHNPQANQHTHPRARARCALFLSPQSASSL